MDIFGFIVIRHVNDGVSCEYWKECCKCIRTHYDNNIPIIIIDDNSDPEFLNDEQEQEYYQIHNIRVVNNHFTGKGELVPYYYMFKYKLLQSAVILHDSMFIQKHIPFICPDITKPHVQFLWHFKRLSENYQYEKTILSSMKLSQELTYIHDKVNWIGCFGVASFVNYTFLELLHTRYDFFNMTLRYIHNRHDRCCLERVFAICSLHICPYILLKQSMLGCIHQYSKWGITYQEYSLEKETNMINSEKNPIYKVWSGR